MVGRGRCENINRCMYRTKTACGTAYLSEECPSFLLFHALPGGLAQKLIQVAPLRQLEHHDDILRGVDVLHEAYDVWVLQGR